jgi:hypothetical protein
MTKPGKEKRKEREKHNKPKKHTERKPKMNKSEAAVEVRSAGFAHAAEGSDAES